MAAPATSVSLLEAEVGKIEVRPVLLRELLGEVEEDDRAKETRRRLVERLSASFGPQSRWCLFEAPKLRACPCVIYTMKVSVKKATVSWSHRSSRRFLPERRGPAFPIALCRAVEPPPHDRLEQVIHGSGGPGEPDRQGILAGVHEELYYLLELSREKGLIHMEGSPPPPPLREVAVIRPLAGGCGITVTSHVDDLVVQLHDILFTLARPSVTVDIRFSEHWFRLPVGWTEERLYAEDSLHFVDIAAPVQNLAKKLYAMSRQELQERERRRWETEEQRERRLQEEEEAMRKQEEERRKIREQNEERMKRAAEMLAVRRVPLVWDAALWDIKDVDNDAGCCYSKFKLLMGIKEQVSCKCIEQESLTNMLRRVEDLEDDVLPILRRMPASASSSSIQTLGFVEGYIDLEYCGVRMERTHFMDRSGRTLSSVLMTSRGPAKVLTVQLLSDKLDILLDDGMIMSALYGVSVDFHCDNDVAPELLATKWTYHIVCKNVDGEGRISFSVLLVHLKKKLQLQLTKEELEIYSMSQIEEEEINDLAQQWQKKQE
ncbi:hypothetical protein ACP4OV_006660 [Aristida adscensionis]